MPLNMATPLRVSPFTFPLEVVTMGEPEHEAARIIIAKYNNRLIISYFLFSDRYAAHLVSLVAVITSVGESNGWGPIGIAD